MQHINLANIREVICCIIMRYMTYTDIREVDMLHNYAAYLNTNIGEVHILHNYVAYQPHEFSRGITQIMLHIITNVRKPYTNYCSISYTE